MDTGTREKIVSFAVLESFGTITDNWKEGLVTSEVLREDCVVLIHNVETVVGDKKFLVTVLGKDEESWFYSDEHTQIMPNLKRAWNYIRGFNVRLKGGDVRLKRNVELNEK